MLVNVCLNHRLLDIHGQDFPSAVRDWAAMNLFCGDAHVRYHKIHMRALNYAYTSNGFVFPDWTRVNGLRGAFSCRTYMQPRVRRIRNLGARELQAFGAWLDTFAGSLGHHECAETLVLILRRVGVQPLLRVLFVTNETAPTDLHVGEVFRESYE